MVYPSYSIAIRTLGTAGDKYRQELESICLQTVQPERVLVYIAEGYSRPEFSIGKEEYVWVKKGLVAQRALPYDEITSDCILMMDDDVLLAPDSTERMLKAMTEHGADAVGADFFPTHRMGFLMKAYAAAVSFVFPHWSRKWAFKIHNNGSFSYNNHPSRSFYWSQSCSGVAFLWKKSVLKELHHSDELWHDSLGFAYADDMVLTYKLFLNGGHLGVLYDSGAVHLDAQSNSSGFKKSSDRIYIRTKAQFMIWYRCIYRNGADTAVSRLLAAAAYGLKAFLLTFVMCGASVFKLDKSIIVYYMKGLHDGFRTVHSQEFRSIPSYYLKKR